jgi:hypothetical protein
MFIIFLLQCLREREINTLGHTVTLLLFLLSPMATDLSAPSIHQKSKYPKSHYRLTSSTFTTINKAYFSLRQLKQIG